MTAHEWGWDIRDRPRLKAISGGGYDEYWILLHFLGTFLGEKGEATLGSVSDGGRSIIVGDRQRMIKSSDSGRWMDTGKFSRHD